MLRYRGWLVLAIGVAFAGCSPADRAEAGAAQEAETGAEEQPKETPYVMADSPEEAGRYLAYLGGCHDCHTAGWIETGGQVPESEWLKGSAVGWRGPWGTTYPPNLRLTVQNMSEEAWVEMFRTRTERPPMPWVNFQHKSDQDLIAIYRFIQSLGPPGQPAPAYLPPGQEPEPPYFNFVLPEQGEGGG